MRVKFASLIRKASKKLSNVIEIEDLEMFLVTLFSSEESSNGSSIVTSVMKSCHTLREVFLAFGNKALWSYTNYSLLRSIVEEFKNDDQELKDLIQQYESDFTGYILTQKIKTYISAVQSDPELQQQPPLEETPELFQRLTIEVGVQITKHSMKYVHELWTTLSHLFRLPMPLLILRKVVKNCIRITFSVPSNLVAQIVRQTQINGSNLRKHQILRVMVGDQYIYQHEVEPHLVRASAILVIVLISQLQAHLSTYYLFTKKCISFSIVNHEDIYKYSCLHRFTVDIILFYNTQVEEFWKACISGQADRVSDLLPHVNVDATQPVCRHIQLFLFATVKLIAPSMCLYMCNPKATDICITNKISAFSTQDGTTPLMVASMRGDVTLVKVLLQAGANPDMQDEVSCRAPTVNPNCNIYRAQIYLLPKTM